MDRLRRILLKGIGSSGVLAAALAAGILRPTQVLAAEWNKSAFEAKDLAGALRGLNASSSAESTGILFRAPDIAENGAVVPIDISSNIPNTTSIFVLVEKNPNALSAYFDFTSGALPDVSLRLKLAQTSMVKVVVKADGKFYTLQKEVKVTVGGCGG